MIKKLNINKYKIHCRKSDYMLSFIKSYLVTFIIFTIIELIWLLVLAKDLYQKEIGYIMKDKPNLVPAVIFMLIFVAGLTFFVIDPAVLGKGWSYALFAGILYGIVTYATYTLTNLSNLENWPLKVSIIDLIWGIVLGGSVSTISYFILNRLK